MKERVVESSHLGYARGDGMITQFARELTPNWEGLRRCILRDGTPDRVYYIELFLDPEDAGCGV